MARLDEIDGERGAVVLTASVAAFEGQIGQINYSASKAGIVGMTIVAARDLASKLIRVYTIAPGTMDTPLLARLRDDVRASLAASSPESVAAGPPVEFGAPGGLDPGEQLPQRRDHPPRRRDSDGAAVTTLDYPAVTLASLPASMAPTVWRPRGGGRRRPGAQLRRTRRRSAAVAAALRARRRSRPRRGADPPRERDRIRARLLRFIARRGHRHTASIRCSRCRA